MILLTRYVSQISLQLCEVETRIEVSLFSFRRKYCISFINTFVPPSPGTLLGVAPSKNSNAIAVIRSSIHCMSVIRQCAWNPWLMVIKILLCILLNLETQINTSKQLNSLLNVCVIFRINFYISQNLFSFCTFRLPVV